METLKVLSRATTALTKDIQSVIEVITQQYDIVYKGTEKKVSMEELERLLLPKTCCVVSPNTGSRCKGKCYNGSMYCSKHYNKHIQQQLTNKHASSQMDECDLHLVKGESGKIGGNAEEVFIEDAFYLVDSSFIYDKSTREKVGYIDNGEFVLTDDPFILNIID